MEGLPRAERYLDDLLSTPTRLVNWRMCGWSFALIGPAPVASKRCVRVPLRFISIDPGCVVPIIRATSPSTTIRNAMTQYPRILTAALVCYTISATAFAFFHVISSSYTPNGGFRFFVKSKFVVPAFRVVNVLTSRRKHPFYLNGRVVFLLFSQIVHGILFPLRNVLHGRSITGWKPSSSVSPTVYVITGSN